MNETKLESLKKRVESYGRKRLANDIGMTYDLLTKKLNGYAVLKDSDREKIVSCLNNNKSKLSKSEI